MRQIDLSVEGEADGRQRAAAHAHGPLLVLGAAGEARGWYSSPKAVLSGLDDAFPKTLGSLLIRDGEPIRMLAVVHDLDREPSWNEEAISESIRKVFQACGDGGIGRVAMPFLGTKWGTLAPHRFVRLLGDSLSGLDPSGEILVWLELPEGSGELDLAPLEPWLER